MTDIASLGLRVDTSGPDQGTASLNRMAAAAGSAQTATQGVTSASTGLSAAQGGVASSVNTSTQNLNAYTRAVQGAQGATQAFARTPPPPTAPPPGGGGGGTGGGGGGAGRGPGGVPGPGQPGFVRQNVQSNVVGNLTAQLQDIAVQVQGGQSPLTIALQQGTQIAYAFQAAGLSGRSAVGGIVAALRSLISVQQIVILGTIAAIGYTSQWLISLLSTKKELPSMNDLLKQQAEVMKLLGNSYSEAAKRATELRQSIGGIDLKSRLSETALTLSMLQELRGQNEADSFESQTGFQLTAQSQLARIRGGLGSIVPTFRVDPQFEAFEKPIIEFQKTINAGKPDVLTFRKAVEDTWNTIGRGDKDITEAAGLLLKWTNSVEEAARAIAELELAQKRLMQSVGPNGMLKASGFLAQEDMSSFASFQIEEQKLAERRQQAFEASISSIFARSPQELAAVARAREEAQYNQNETPRARADRIELAGKQALIEAEHELKEAQRERDRAGEQAIDQQRIELQLIGQTAGEQARLRYEFEKTQEVREAAARSGVAADEAEIARIQERARLMGELADQISKVNLQQDIAFERSQIFRSEGDQDIASRLRAAGQPVDFNSELAKQLRVNQELERMRDTWQSIFDEVNSGIDQLFDNLWEGGQDFGEVLKGIGRDLARMMFDLAVTNPIKNWLTGAELPNIGDLGIFRSGASSGRGGGFGGFLGNILGAQKAVASMQVQAATVIVNGSVIPGLGGLPGVGNLLGGTGDRLTSHGITQNLIQSRIDQAFGTTSGPTTGASFIQDMIQDRISTAFGDVLGSAQLTGSTAQLATGQGVAGQVWNFFAQKNLAPHQIAGIMGNISAESAFNPLAVGDAGNAFGLFQWNDRAGSLFNSIGGRGNLGDVQRQLEFAWSELLGSESGVLSRLRSATDVRGATEAFVGFERPSGWSLENPAGAMHFDRRLDAATQALERFGGSADTLTDTFTHVTTSGFEMGTSLTQAAGGLNNFGSMLSSFMANPQGGASSWFGSLVSAFGGQAGAMQHITSFGPQATRAILSGAAGLYHTGGVVGSNPSGYRFVSPSVFLNAPRYHNGGIFGQDEMPAIVKRGEPIFKSMDHARQAVGGGNTGEILSAIKKMKQDIKMINLLDPSIVGDYLQTNEGEEVVMNVIRRNPRTGGRP